MESARVRRQAGVALALLAGACAHDWTNADLQLDVTDFPFSDADRIVICVEGAGVQAGAAADGLLAFPGIPDEFPRTVTVANDDGLGGSVEFDEVGYKSIRAGEQTTIGDCPGERAELGTGLDLAVRLLP